MEDDEELIAAWTQSELCPPSIAEQMDRPLSDICARLSLLGASGDIQGYVPERDPTKPKANSILTRADQLKVSVVQCCSYEITLLSSESERGFATGSSRSRYDGPHRRCR